VYVRYQTLMKIYIMQSEYRPTRRQGSIGGGGDVLGEAGRYRRKQGGIGGSGEVQEGKCNLGIDSGRRMTNFLVVRS